MNAQSTWARRLDVVMRLVCSREALRDSPGAKYDRERIENIDFRRQEIVHQTAFSVVQESIEKDLDYLDATTAYVMRLVNYKYCLPVDLEFWLKYNQKRSDERAQSVKPNIAR